MTLEECKIYLKTMRYYTPTRVDFTKTYHSPPKIHGVYGDSSWSPCGLHEDSMETRGGLSNTALYCHLTWQTQNRATAALFQVFRP